jgi:hypothetical protein
MNGFSNDEIVLIMRAVKGLTKSSSPELPPALPIPAADLIFAKTTPNSLTMVLGDIIADMSQDHAYLKANPPPLPRQA